MDARFSPRSSADFLASRPLALGSSGLSSRNAGAGAVSTRRRMAPSRSRQLRKHLRLPVVSSYSQDTSSFLTLEEVSPRRSGGARKKARKPWCEVATASSLYSPAEQRWIGQPAVLINRSRRPLLLLAGELVSGGKQDRVIGKDRIVPAGGPPLPLRCVLRRAWPLDRPARNSPPRIPSFTPACAKVRRLIRFKRKSGNLFANGQM